MISKKDIENLIDTKEFMYRDTYTICLLTLKNGFKITGTAGLVNPEEYDKELGEEYAYKSALDKLFNFEAYHQKRL